MHDIDDTDGHCCNIHFCPSESKENENENEQKYGESEYLYSLTPDMNIEANLIHLLTNNEYVWGTNNLQFNVNRWIETNPKTHNKIFKMQDKLFGDAMFCIGQRNCAGKSIAMKMIYGFMANLIVNYQIGGPVNKPVDFDIKYKSEYLRSVDPDIPLTIGHTHIKRRLSDVGLQKIA